jgi:hypothetical protein
MSHPPVLDAGQVVVLLLGDHEGGQVGGVAGQEHQGEQCPHVGQEATGHAARVIRRHGRSEQHRPDQPERAKQREPVLWECYKTALRPDIIHIRQHSGRITISVTISVTSLYNTVTPYTATFNDTAYVIITFESVPYIVTK